jgi:hypothetical protein
MLPHPLLQWLDEVLDREKFDTPVARMERSAIRGNASAISGFPDGASLLPGTILQPSSTPTSATSTVPVPDSVMVRRSRLAPPIATLVQAPPAQDFIRRSTRHMRGRRAQQGLPAPEIGIVGQQITVAAGNREVRPPAAGSTTGCYSGQYTSRLKCRLLARNRHGLMSDLLRFWRQSGVALRDRQGSF